MIDWTERLVQAGSERRGPVLLDAVASTADPAEARKLVEENWTICEAWGGHLDDALLMLERLVDELDVEHIGDAPLPDEECFTIYRATFGEDDEPDGGSWTLERSVAERFARMLASPRAWFLFGKAAQEPVIWRAEVLRGDVLAYFTKREESEVVVPQGAAWDVTAISRLVRQ